MSGSICTIEVSVTATTLLDIITVVATLAEARAAVMVAGAHLGAGDSCTVLWLPEGTKNGLSAYSLANSPHALSSLSLPT